MEMGVKMTKITCVKYTSAHTSSLLFGLLMALFIIGNLLTTANAVDKSGTSEDDAYAALVWKYMEENKFVGQDRMRSHPFVGNRPHGSIQESIATEAIIDGHKGRLIVKQNYGGKGKFTPKDVYSAGGNTHLEAITIMFRREKGYDPDHNDWFWAEYKPDSSIIVYDGERLVGRANLCTSCHAALGGNDREILNGNNR